MLIFNVACVANIFFVNGNVVSNLWKNREVGEWIVNVYTKNGIVLYF